MTRREFRDGSAYPPARSGMRGSHPGSFDVAHALRDGSAFALDGLPVDEEVDLVVVGAGISGLAAAWSFRQRRPEASILVLDNHDDFGGHAKRNEVRVGERLLIGYGGSESMQSPNALYSPEAKTMLASLGVDLTRFETAFDRELYPSLGLSRGVFFTREAFGRDVLVPGDPMRMVADDIAPDRMHARPTGDFIADFPVSSRTRSGLIELYDSPRNPLESLSRQEAATVLRTTSYRDYLLFHWGLSEEAADTFQGRTLDFFALGIDRVSAYDAMQTGYPGFTGIDLPVDPGAAAEMDEPYIHHFPDGNASIARLIVRSLIPETASGHTMEDIVTAIFDYGALDDPASPVRIRLESTAVRVRNRDRGVDIGYVHGGRLHMVRARCCVMAGYHMMIPAVMPELPDPQRRALHENIKAPIAYVKVAVRDWHPWVRLGVHEVTSPMGFFSRIKLDYPVDLGSYRCPRTPEEPMLLHLVHVPTDPGGGTAREQHRRGRTALFELTFADFEAKLRDELSRMLGPGGFEADRDIAGVVVNRWGHGYSYGGDPLLGRGAEEPPAFIAARAPAGNVAFANADAAWEAYAHAAIDQAFRAVGELLG